MFKRGLPDSMAAQTQRVILSLLEQRISDHRVPASFTINYHPEHHVCPLGLNACATHWTVKTTYCDNILQQRTLANGRTSCHRAYTSPNKPTSSYQMPFHARHQPTFPKVSRLTIASPDVLAASSAFCSTSTCV